MGKLHSGSIGLNWWRQRYDKPSSQLSIGQLQSFLDDLHALGCGGIKQSLQEPRSGGTIHEQIHHSEDYGRRVTCNITFWKPRRLPGSRQSLQRNK